MILFKTIIKKSFYLLNNYLYFNIIYNISGFNYLLLCPTISP